MKVSPDLQAAYTKWRNTKPRMIYIPKAKANTSWPEICKIIADSKRR